jgi:hypothetical protein
MMSPVRSLLFVLAVAVTFITPLLTPEDGVTVTHHGELLTHQLVPLEVTLIDCEPSDAAKPSHPGDTVSEADVEPACVTVTVRVIPPPLKVMVAVRSLGSGLASISTDA